MGLGVNERAFNVPEAYLTHHSLPTNPRTILPPPIIINVPVVYIVRDVMILMRENPFRGPLEGVDPENLDFFGP